ncbi:hypothetical protein MP638_006271 [Amoeboaphelidium occidentale]|nr:hypothetical protein MP638_006271 [Amoeboaphelidium occidentale]
MSLYLIAEIILSAVAVSLVCELLCWYFVYQIQEYHSLVNQQNKLVALLEKQKLEGSNAVDQKKSVKKKANKTETELKRVYALSTGYNFRLSMINMLVLLGAYQVVLTAYEGIVVGKLPFVPFALFQGLTHRGLAGEDFQECSAHLIFAMGLLLGRTNIQKFLEYRGIRPVAPQLMNQLMEWQADALGFDKDTKKD